MIPSLRGVHRQHALPGCCGQQQHCGQQQRLLLSAKPRQSTSRSIRQSYAQPDRLVYTPADHAAASMPQPEAAPVVPASSTAAAPDDLTAAAEHALLHGNGLARAILSQPGIEGDPLAFLKATEAYWKVGSCSAVLDIRHYYFNVQDSNCCGLAS